MGIRGLQKVREKHNQDQARREHQGAANAAFDKQMQIAEEKIVRILEEQELVSLPEARPEVAQTACGDIATLRVAEIMSRNVAVLEYDDTLLVVQGLLDCVRFRHIPIVDENGCILGLISDRDYLRVISPFYGTVNEQSRDMEIMLKKVGTVMTHNPQVIHTGYSIEDCIKLMTKDRISCLPVVEPGTTKLQGIITWKDIVRAFCPGGFADHESARLKTGIQINPDPEAARKKAAEQNDQPRTTESGRVVQEEAPVQDTPNPADEVTGHTEYGERVRVAALPLDPDDPDHEKMQNAQTVSRRLRRGDTQQYVSTAPYPPVTPDTARREAPPPRRPSSTTLHRPSPAAALHRGSDTAARRPGDTVMRRASDTAHQYRPDTGHYHQGDTGQQYRPDTRQYRQGESDRYYHQQPAAHHSTSQYRRTSDTGQQYRPDTGHYRQGDSDRYRQQQPAAHHSTGQYHRASDTAQQYRPDTGHYRQGESDRYYHQQPAAHHSTGQYRRASDTAQQYREDMDHQYRRSDTSHQPQPPVSRDTVSRARPTSGHDTVSRQRPSVGNTIARPRPSASNTIARRRTDTGGVTMHQAGSHDTAVRRASHSVQAMNNLKQLLQNKKK